MKKLAIIGSGISGTPIAYYLQDQYDIEVYEKSSRVGGHAHTLDLDEDGHRISLDTAFVVCNKPNYPNLMKFFADLGVETQNHLGGFNFYNLDSGMQFNSLDLELSLEEFQRQQPPELVACYHEAKRFFSEARSDFWEGKTRVSMQEYLDANNYSQGFRDNFVMLMGSAVWSIPTDLLMEFPASTFISFFMTHDQGGLGGKTVEWETVKGGSSRYVEKVKDALKKPIKTQQEVISVKKRSDGKVIVKTKNDEAVFDKVVIATHADQALEILAEPTELEQKVLGCFKYNETAVTVHTDPVIMNPDRSKWQSWNYGQVVKEGQLYTYVTYYSNKVHSFEAKKDYFVSLDTPPMAIDQDKIIRVIKYRHPAYDMNTLEAQKQIYQLNETGPIYFSGTYFHIKKRGIDSYGFHESGIGCAVELVERLKKGQF
ncbi:FAD-dependent oxidoreductase [Calothrix sp. FACHB-1219]|uniref:NAD(P)/FAD-dependent oxidoreductase n=1 Tax=unclassified Calothrix TaxID=2619626 RepID=UPI001681CB8E|nr:MULTISPECIES: FAD-dependent oxidoreductase [unclassified Calothrix]MBD2203717.1 FAD-dependent oxidoreductase [Calothrix sp. FACHB-168]MBD2222062.1 FAD-dependent oxidoreductase [Calothrix sp. FACHB-1219]